MSAAETLDRTPVEPWGNECCGAGNCETCFRVQYPEDVTDTETGEVTTEVVYHNATDEMVAHHAVCEPYQAQLKAAADAKAAEDKALADAAAAREALVIHPAQVYDLGNGSRVIVFTDPDGKSQVLPLPDGVS